MPGQRNWNLSRVKLLIRQEKDAETIMEETGIKMEPLRALAAGISAQDKRFYRVRGLFDDDQDV